MKKYVLFPWIFIFLFSCVGTDEIDIEQPIISVQEKIEVTPLSQAVLVNGQATFIAKYTNKQGIEKNVAIDWVSENPSICSISTAGIATGLSEGTSMIYAKYGDLKSNKAVLNVVENSTELATITVTGTKTMLPFGQKTTLSAKSFDLNNNELSGVTYSWVSMDENLATVDANGEVTVSTTTTGTAIIYAMSNGKSSNLYEINVFDPTATLVRIGAFEGYNGYSVSGEVHLEQQAGGDIFIKFTDSFLSASGPGLYVYLTTSNTDIIGTGIEIQALTQLSGASEINVSALYPNITLTDYQYVIIHCKPFNVRFGGALLSDVQ